ncbi:MAG: hypothetical protein HY352_02190 [Candidatus Omnitrophica bacterium]|nr:hypothetical protein [Candidatus Omnitrophota bacterium]
MLRLIGQVVINGSDSFLLGTQKVKSSPMPAPVRVIVELIPFPKPATKLPPAFTSSTGWINISVQPNAVFNAPRTNVAPACWAYGAFGSLALRQIGQVTCLSSAQAAGAPPNANIVLISNPTNIGVLMRMAIARQ